MAEAWLVYAACWVCQTTLRAWEPPGSPGDQAGHGNPASECERCQCRCPWTTGHQALLRVPGVINSAVAGQGFSQGSTRSPETSNPEILPSHFTLGTVHSALEGPGQGTWLGMEMPIACHLPPRQPQGYLGAPSGTACPPDMLWKAGPQQSLHSET